jgi:hypothetical protein
LPQARFVIEAHEETFEGARGIGAPRRRMRTRRLRLGRAQSCLRHRHVLIAGIRRLCRRSGRGADSDKDCKQTGCRDETEWPIVFQTAERLLIFAIKLRTKVSAILLTAAQIRQTIEVSRAATESAILFHPRVQCASSPIMA